MWWTRMTHLSVGLLELIGALEYLYGIELLGTSALSDFAKAAIKAEPWKLVFIHSAGQVLRDMEKTNS